MADAVKYGLPASPNWYCSSVSDFSLTGIYAFGAKNCVYLLDTKCEPPELRGQLCGHSERVSSVCFCKHELGAELAVSGADDRFVKVWDVKKKEVVAEHKGHQAKITGISWSPVVPDLIISGDEKGHIICWRYMGGNFQQGCPVADQIFCIAASSLAADKVAVGYKSGLILVVGLDEGDLKVLCKLRGHESEVHSIAWCPVSTDYIEFGPLQEKVTGAEDSVLMSGSRDQSLRLWDATHGKILSIFQLPKRSGQRWRERHGDGQTKERLWLSICWPAGAPNRVISSSHGGDLLLCCVGKEGKEQFKTFSSGHSRIVFNISCNADASKAISVSMDRQIIVWDLQSLKAVCTVPTLGGFVYSLCVCPLDPGTVGLGVGDNMVRVWHTTSPLGPYDAFSLWQGIKSKVMAVQWHPLKEGWLAFGTDDGQVGICNILTKRVESSASYHKKSVYSIAWGPPCPAIEGADSSARHLYSCGGEGLILQHRPGHFLDDAADVNALIGKTNGVKHKLYNSTEVAWAPDGSVMAVGNEDGSIEVFSAPDLSRLGLITVHRKSITCLAWHHGIGTLSSSEERDSPDCKFWLASGSNESVLHVHDLKGVLRGELSNPATLLTESWRQLAGHSGRVTRISWSPHQPERLVSSSYDGTAQVWDVMTGQPVANFRGHVGRVMSVAWSYLDPDVVYSGGEDGTVRPWRPSQVAFDRPPTAEKKGGHSGGSSTRGKKKNKHKPAKDKHDADHGNWRQEMHNGATSTPAAHSGPKVPDRDQGDGTKPTGATSTADTHAPTVAEEKNHQHLQVGCERVRDPTLLVEESGVRGRGTSPEQHVESSADYHNGVKGVLDVGSSGARASDGATSKKKKKVKSMFPLSAVADNKSKAVTQDECITLSKFLFGQTSDAATSGGTTVEPGSHGHVNLGMFAGRPEAYRMLQTEGEYHRSNGNVDYQFQLEIWKGNLTGALEVAIRKRQLNDWLVSLSPLGGRDLWLTTTEAYAKQLVSQGAYHRAVLHFLACYKVYQAIEVFSNQAMYREAIALAKVRLSPLDPVLRDLYCSWARKLEAENAYEQAAKCYLAVQLPADAVQALSRRGDAASLKTAFQVALTSRQKELAVPFALRLAHSSLLEAEWEDAAQILSSCPDVEAHILPVYVHEMLFDAFVECGIFHGGPANRTAIAASGSEESPVDELIREHADAQARSPWLLASDQGVWFVLRMLHTWHLKKLLRPSLPHVTSLFATLSSFHGSHHWSSSGYYQMAIEVSYEISLGVLAFLLGQWDTGARYWLEALASCRAHCLYKLQRDVCSLLLPRGVESLENMAVIKHKLLGGGVPFYKPHVDCAALFHPFLAFYCVSLLYEIWWKNPNVLGVLLSPLPAGAEAEEGTDRSSQTEENPIPEPSTDASCLSSPFQRGTRYTLHSLVLNISQVVLSDREAQLKALKDRLVLVRKVLTTNRARKQLEEAASSSKLNKRRLKGLKKTEQDVAAATGNASVDGVVNPDEDQPENPTDDVIACKEASIYKHGEVEEADMTETLRVPLGEQRAPSAQETPVQHQPENSSSAEESARVDRGEVDARDGDFQLTASGEPILEERYLQRAEDLDFLAEEEGLIQEKLQSLKQKGLSFPDPIEAALVICSLCMRIEGLSQIETDQCRRLGQRVVQWAVKHAQSSKEISSLQKLNGYFKNISP